MPLRSSVKIDRRATFTFFFFFFDHIVISAREEFSGRSSHVIIVMQESRNFYGPAMYNHVSRSTIIIIIEIIKRSVIFDLIFFVISEKHK